MKKQHTDQWNEIIILQWLHVLHYWYEVSPICYAWFWDLEHGIFLDIATFWMCQGDVECISPSRNSSWVYTYCLRWVCKTMSETRVSFLKNGTAGSIWHVELAYPDQIITQYIDSVGKSSSGHSNPFTKMTKLKLRQVYMLPMWQSSTL